MQRENPYPSFRTSRASVEGRYDDVSITSIALKRIDSDRDSKGKTDLPVRTVHQPDLRIQGSDEHRFFRCGRGEHYTRHRCYKGVALFMSACPSPTNVRMETDDQPAITSSTFSPSEDHTSSPSHPHSLPRPPHPLPHSVDKSRYPSHPAESGSVLSPDSLHPRP